VSGTADLAWKGMRMMRIHGKRAVPGLALAMAVPLIPCLAYLAAGHVPPAAPRCSLAICGSIPARPDTGNHAYIAGSRPRPRTGEPGHPAMPGETRPRSSFLVPRHPPGLTGIYRRPAPGDISRERKLTLETGRHSPDLPLPDSAVRWVGCPCPGRETVKEIGRAATSPVFRNRAPQPASPGSALDESTLSAQGPRQAAVRPAERWRPPGRQDRRRH